METESRRIPLRVAQKKAYVWDVDDIAVIRSKHHICGILVGTLPHLSQQNVFQGVPLLLMPEEAVLLVENELAVLVDDHTVHLPATVEQLQEWSATQETDVKQQVALLEAKGANDSSKAGRAMSEEALSKRKAREEKKAALAEVAARLATFSSEGPVVFLASGDAEVAQSASLGAKEPTVFQPGLPNEQSSSITSSATAYTAVIPAASSSLSWYSSHLSSYSSIASAKEAGIWDYPATLQERARYGVFRSLWEQGYFIGGGIKFGGDYLVYPGDPLRYHSHFAATILDSPLRALRPMEIVAHGRLGTATKKGHLLCRWDDEKKDVSYLTIEWAGFG